MLQQITWSGLMQYYHVNSFNLMEKPWERMGFILLFLLFLASFQFSNGIKCSTDNTFPCRCILSDGPEGFVDISPLFYDGPLSAVSSKSHFTYKYDPCRGLECGYPCKSGKCAICQGSAGNPSNPTTGVASLNTAQYTITKYDPKSSYLSMRVAYTLGNDNRKAFVDFIYNATVQEPSLVFDSEHPQETYTLHLITNGPGVKIINTTVPSGSTSGPYPIQKDACTGWSGDKSVLASSGLLKLSAQATVLNFTWIEEDYMFEYYVGVCVTPVSTALHNCYVVQKETAPNGDVSLHCLGGNVDVQVTETKDEGWILLSYTYGDRYDYQCDKSARRSKIYFFCSRGAGPGSPMYIQQNPLQEECFYRFNWPTDILCGVFNTTQTSPMANQAPLSLESSVLIGISGGSFLLIVVLLVVFTITACYLCGRRTSPSTNKYRRLNEERE